MIIALDLETTGLDSKKDKIIEIALIAFDEQTFEIIDTFTTLIHPGISIPEINSNITGIFDVDVKDAPIFDAEMAKKVQEFIGKSPILGHNTYFDRDFLLQNEVDIEENIVLDTFVLANILVWNEKSLNLGSLCENFGIHTGDSHRAFDDTQATIGLFQYLIQIFQSLSLSQKQFLNHLFLKSEHSSFSFYREYFKFQEIQKLSQDDFMTQILDVVGKYHVDPKGEIPFPKQNIDDIFASLPNFEIRENQTLMAKKVHESLFESKKVVIEAPTGVGKTFAYSIPGVLYSAHFGEAVIISTHTKALQDQIFYKDLSYLQKNTEISFTYAKLKGKKNYFSISQFFATYFGQNSFDIDETAFFGKVILWLHHTDFGELDELTFYPKEFQIVKNLHSDYFFVLHDDNEYKYYEYLFKARSYAQNANIVVVNHAVLLQDIKTKNSIFPEMKHLIIDEAHNLEDTTTDALKKTFQVGEIQEHSQKIISFLHKNSQVVDNIETLLEDVYQQVAFIFDILGDYTSLKNTYGNEVFEVGIQSDFFKKEENIYSQVEKIQSQIHLLQEKLDLIDEKLIGTIRSSVRFFEEMLDILTVTLHPESYKNYISIFMHNSRYGSSLGYTLLHPGKFLKKELYDTLDSLVITSATLQIDGNFDYFKSILSLDDDFEFVTLESDFDYKKQSLLFIPNNLGSARYNNPVMYQFILDFLSFVKGQSLVLMTSFSSIRDVYLFINTALKKLGVDVLAQSIGGSKHKIINHYKKFYKKSVILGTDSFWEGVDFPGDELKYLIIHKFPFDVPTDPVFQARSALFQDSFVEYSIPKAIIKTKQGFGRLIRTKQDTGIVILLDDRVYQTQWGKKMLQSFPQTMNIKTGHSDTFLKMISEKQSG